MRNAKCDMRKPLPNGNGSTQLPPSRSFSEFRISNSEFSVIAAETSAAVETLHSLSKGVISDSVRMTFHLLAAAAMAAAPVAAATRPPAVAGAFYTDDAVALRIQVEHMLERAGEGGEPGEPVRAVVAPHAGYVFSGPTAAKALTTLAASPPRRVILLGPSHYEGFRGGALPGKGIEAFATPLGRVKLDLAAIETLRADPDFGGPASAHGPEHSLEVELPILQVVAPEAKIVPVLVGYDTDRGTALRLARALARLLNDETVVIVSSDFTHHGARYRYAPFEGRQDLGDQLLAVGRSTAGRLAAVDADGFWSQVEVSGDTVCGRRPLAVLMELLAHCFAGSGTVTDVTTSGHVSGSFDMSVTYASIVFSGSWRPWTEQADGPEPAELNEAQGDRLLELARATLRSHLAHDDSLALWFAKYGVDPAFRSLAGAFVTVNNTGRRAAREGKLRACMGIIEAREPVVDGVISAAVSAAHDPRFPELQLDELEQVELEVSVLSPSKRVDSPQQIVVGTHGVVLIKGRHKAVFLPQVAPEQGWDRDEMLDHLSTKAGLPPDGWRHGTEFEVFTAQVYAEDS